MSTFKSEFLNVLSERGFIHQISDPEGLDAAAVTGRITGYIGFDATATSLHAGSLVQIMMLRWMQKTGHRPIALMGGGTTKIGDPSFKDESRKLLTVEQINSNLQGIKEVFTKFLTFRDGGSDAGMANNADWGTFVAGGVFLLVCIPLSLQVRRSPESSGCNLTAMLLPTCRLRESTRRCALRPMSALATRSRRWRFGVWRSRCSLGSRLRVR